MKGVLPKEGELAREWRLRATLRSPGDRRLASLPAFPMSFPYPLAFGIDGIERKCYGFRGRGA